jgi:hypothetical protein
MKDESLNNDYHTTSVTIPPKVHCIFLKYSIVDFQNSSTIRVLHTRYMACCNWSTKVHSSHMNVLKMGEFGSLMNVTNFPKQCSLYCPHRDFVYLSLPFWAKVFFLDLCYIYIYTYTVWYNLSQIICKFMQVKIVFDHRLFSF